MDSHSHQTLGRVEIMVRFLLARGFPTHRNISERIDYFRDKVVALVFAVVQFECSD